MVYNDGKILVGGVVMKDIEFIGAMMDKYGAQGAFILHFLCFCTYKNCKDDEVYEEGVYWLTDCADSVIGMFSFWTWEQADNILFALVKSGALLHSSMLENGVEGFSVVAEVMEKYIASKDIVLQ